MFCVCREWGFVCPHSLAIFAGRVGQSGAAERLDIAAAGAIAHSRAPERGVHAASLFA